MIVIVLLGMLAMSACLALQASALSYAIRHFARAEGRANTSLRAVFLQLAGLMIALMIGNIVQIVIWALIYLVLNQFDDFETAAYFSGVTFTTLGYGDEVLTGRVRLLAPLQAANGVMMFGLSSAALYAAVQRALAPRLAEKRLQQTKP